MGAGAGARRWWQPCEEYSRQVEGFTRRDAWLAVGLLAVSLVLNWLTGALEVRWPRLADDGARLALGLAQTAVVVGLAALVLRARRQGWTTAGFSRTHLRPSLLVGLLFVGPGLAMGRLVSMAGGTAPSPDWTWLTFWLPFFLIPIAFAEEFTIRAFLTPRLSGAFRHRWIGVLLGGAAFALSHVPYRLEHTDLPAWELMVSMLPNFGLWMAWHLAYWWLYARWNSLAAPVLFHFAVDYSMIVM